MVPKPRGGKREGEREGRAKGPSLTELDCTFALVFLLITTRIRCRRGREYMKVQRRTKMHP